MNGKKRTNSSSSSRARRSKDDKNFELLAKNSFTCLLIGARQTGKQTIVKCFVKLVNEFRLAAAEYRREKILTKLMDCSERLQELAARQEQLELEERERHQAIMAAAARSGGGDRRRSRVNSWLGGKLLTHLPASATTKLRLHSLVPTLSGADTPTSSAAAARLEQLRQQRRHTAVGSAATATTTSTSSGFRPATCGSECDGGGKDDRGGRGFAAAGSRSQVLVRDAPGRHSTKERRRPTAEFLQPEVAQFTCCNKSDFNINYLDTDHEQRTSGQADASGGADYIVINQLQVPSSRCHPASTQSRGSFTSSALSLCKPAAAAGGSTSALEVAAASQPQSPARCIRISTEAIQDLDKRRRRSSSNKQHHNHHYHHHHRQETTEQKRHARQTTVSLKEINRRRIRVKFSTRRQLSDKFFDVSTRAKSEKEAHREASGQLPDSIMVVYSVNDR